MTPRHRRRYQAPPNLSEVRIVFVHEGGRRFHSVECIQNCMQMSQGWRKPCRDHGLGFESKIAFAEPPEAFEDGRNFRSHSVPDLLQHFENLLSS